MFQQLLFRQFRHLYQCDLWMRRHFSITGHFVLILMLAAAVFGVDTHSSNTYQLFVFLAAITVFALLGSIRNTLKTRLKRNLPKYMTVGEPTSYSITIDNLSNKPYQQLSVIDTLEALPSNLAGINEVTGKHKFRPITFQQWRHYQIFLQGARIPEVQLGSLNQQAVRVLMNLTPIRRGLLTFSKCYIAKPDMLGLFRRLLVNEKPQTCMVLPQRYPVKNLNPANGRRYQPGGINLANSVGDSSEFISLRDYHYGDPKHAIHWKSLAKHGKLIVKEFQDEYFARKALLLDTLVGPDSFFKFEAAVSVAASITFSDRQNDSLLDLLFAGDQVYRFTSGRSVDSMPHIQEILATVQLSDQTDFELFEARVLQHIPLCSSMICIFIHWNEQRQDFFRQLQQSGISILTLVVYDSKVESNPISDLETDFLRAIDSRHIAEGLALL